MIASGALAYLGAFTNIYREELMEMWISKCKDLNIKITSNYNLIGILADPYEIRLWNMYGLPRDQTSTENAAIVMQSSRWPLMIDPQEQVTYIDIIFIRNYLCFLFSLYRLFFFFFFFFC